MTSHEPYLLDTCTIINITYSHQVTKIFEIVVGANLGWLETVRLELKRRVAANPQLPNSLQALRWANLHLGTPIEMTEDNADLSEVNEIQIKLEGLGSVITSQHLGEASTISHLLHRGDGYLVSDDHSARSEARSRGVRAISSVGIVDKVLASGLHISNAEADQYFNRLRSANRMNINLTASTLRGGNMMGWG